MNYEIGSEAALKFSSCRLAQLVKLWVDCWKPVPSKLLNTKFVAGALRDHTVLKVKTLQCKKSITFEQSLAEFSENLTYCFTFKVPNHNSLGQK